MSMRDKYNRDEALQIIYLTDGIISDNESIPDDSILDPDFMPVMTRDDDEHYFSDSSVDEEQISRITETVESVLKVEDVNSNSNDANASSPVNEPQP